MRSDSSDDFIRNTTHQKTIIKRINYPTEEDLSGAAISLLRLQDTYQMDTKDIADGKVLNSQIRTVALSARDCFEIGRAAYHAFGYYHTILWMQEERDRVEKETVPTANLEDILKYLAFLLHEQDPDHPRAKDSVKMDEDLLEKDGIQRIDMQRDISRINNVQDENEYLEESIRLIYEALCRQVTQRHSRGCIVTIKWTVRYLCLAPFKIEIVRQNPLIVLFYDIMSDEEARIIQIPAVSKASLMLLALYFNIACLFSRNMKGRGEG
ncbi:unnamed protein product, partial [Onchocerca ochengi]|uniref:P4Ha_N domain-containing protein n=1 Tax=Onchocerca ochengi TaxID=42157 RepID=A0A182EPB5_ONCOC